MFRKPADGVIFIDDNLEEEFLFLSEDNVIKKALRRAIDNLKENVFCGKNIPKKLIPKLYTQKYEVDNLWWYPLPDGWRLIYFVTTPSNVEIIAIILEWFNHKDYEKRFGY